MKKLINLSFFIDQFKGINVRLRKITLLVFLCALLPATGHSQKYDKTLLKADKLYIKKDYVKAVSSYEKYLVTHPKDFYASRQAALCYGKVNNAGMAIDYWPAVVESSEASEKDNLEYARCLLANYRIEDARRVFIQLSRSSDKSIAEWGKAYISVSRFFKDSALCKVTEVAGINTPGHEYAPSMRDGKLYFISDPLKNIRLFSAMTNARLFQINEASRKDSMTFSSPAVFHESQVGNVNGLFCFSTDGNTLYLSAAAYSKDLGVKKGEPFYKFQLYNTPATGAGTLQPFKHNSPDYDFMHPCLSKDGNKLYFASDMKGSLGGKDIFVCELVNGEWSPPRNCGPEVNTFGNEIFPYVTEEGLLYFASDARPGLGGLDLFTAKPAVSGRLFETAVNAGSPLNTQYDDFGVFILPGGRTGYLSSNRKNNTDDDIFYFRNAKP